MTASAARTLRLPFGWFAADVPFRTATAIRIPARCPTPHIVTFGFKLRRIKCLLLGWRKSGGASTALWPKAR